MVADISVESTLRHRDVLLRCVQEFLNSLDEDDVAALEPASRDLIKDVALHAGCTNLVWWNQHKEVDGNIK